MCTAASDSWQPINARGSSASQHFGISVAAWPKSGRATACTGRGEGMEQSCMWALECSNLCTGRYATREASLGGLYLLLHKRQQARRAPCCIQNCEPLQHKSQLVPGKRFAHLQCSADFKGMCSACILAGTKVLPANSAAEAQVCAGHLRLFLHCLAPPSPLSASYWKSVSPGGF